jgi:hypothetical protein
MARKADEILTVADAPEIILAEDEEAGDVLLKFFGALGWNGEDMLEPCKVRTTEAVFNRLYDLMLEKCPDRLGTGMFLVNKGPGVDGDVPEGKVYLLKGWIEPANGKIAG